MHTTAQAPPGVEECKLSARSIRSGEQRFELAFSYKLLSNHPDRQVRGTQGANQIHRSIFVAVTPGRQAGNWIDDSAVRQLAAGLSAKSSGLPAATGRAVGLIGARVRLQAYALTFIDGFHLVAWGCVVALLGIALLRKAPLNYGDLGFQDQENPATQGK